MTENIMSGIIYSYQREGAYAVVDDYLDELKEMLPHVLPVTKMLLRKNESRRFHSMLLSWTRSSNSVRVKKKDDRCDIRRRA
jgi:hypothetical protein